MLYGVGQSYGWLWLNQPGSIWKFAQHFLIPHAHRSRVLLVVRTVKRECVASYVRPSVRSCRACFPSRDPCDLCYAVRAIRVAYRCQGFRVARASLWSVLSG